MSIILSKLRSNR